MRISFNHNFNTNKRYNEHPHKQTNKLHNINVNIFIGYYGRQLMRMHIDYNRLKPFK